MAWYQNKTCAVCAKTIGKRYFWQDKPRLVDASGNARDTAYIAEEQAAGLLETHLLVCPPCYFHRFGEAKALAAKQGIVEG